MSRPPLYPGARWEPIVSEDQMSAWPDLATAHEVVSRAERSVKGYNESSRVCHAYNGKDGDFEQNFYWDEIVAGIKEGNGHGVTIESYDGLLIHLTPSYWEEGIGGQYGTSADTGRWDAGQCERWADVFAHLHLDVGIPLRLKPNSQRDQGGFAPHRWGIEPWRSQLGGGESWTNHNGKPCPGDLRVAQMPAIVERARVIAEGIKAGRFGYAPAGPLTGTVLQAALARGADRPTPSTPSKPTTPTEEEDEMNDKDREWIEALLDKKLAADSAADDVVVNPETKNRMSLGDRIIGTVRVMRELFAKQDKKLDAKFTAISKRLADIEKLVRK